MSVFTHLKQYRSDKNGSVMPLFVISLAAIFALVGATLALSMDSRAANSLQKTADSAALAGATAFLNSTSPKLEDRKAQAVQAATTIAEQNAQYQLSELDYASVVEDAYGQHLNMEVDLEFKPVNAAASFTGRNASIDIRRRAVATASWGFPLCLLSLSETGRGLSLRGAGDLTAPNCAIWSNSKDSDSVYMDGAATLKAKSICSAGQSRGGGLAKLDPKVHEDCEPLEDPLATWVAPAIGQCDTIGGLRLTRRGIIADLEPGVFCGGLWAVSDTVRLKPGTYYVKDGPLILNGSDEVIAEGVTFILSGVNASVEISGNGILRLTAPTEGPFAGIALAEDRSTRMGPLAQWLASRKGLRTRLSSTVTGNGQIHIEGLIYLPNQVIEITGNGWGEKSSPYLQIIAHAIDISQLGALFIDFNPSATSVPIVIEPTRTARLIE
ncbi:MAG: hypothetical protein AAGH90_11870 [Pseudomonadota bacterium]